MVPLALCCPPDARRPGGMTGDNGRSGKSLEARSLPKEQPPRNLSGIRTAVKGRIWRAVGPIRFGKAHRRE